MVQLVWKHAEMVTNARSRCIAAHSSADGVTLGLIEVEPWQHPEHMHVHMPVEHSYMRLAVE